MPVSTTDVLISGGGTGGHVFPALALAEELVARGYARDRIRFVGAARGLEATAVPAAGFAVELLPGRGLERSASPAAIGRNLRTAFDTVVAFRARLVVRRSTPASRRRRRRRLRVPPGAGRGPGPADPRRRPRSRRPSGTGQPHRGAPRSPRRGHAPGHPAPGRRGHRQPDPSRHRRGRTGAGGAAPDRGRRRQPRCPIPQPGRTGSVRPLARPHRRHDPPRHGHPRLPRVQHDARGAARARAIDCRIRSSRSRSTWRSCTPRPRWWCPAPAA